MTFWFLQFSKTDLYKGGQKPKLRAYAATRSLKIKIKTNSIYEHHANLLRKYVEKLLIKSLFRSWLAIIC